MIAKLITTKEIAQRYSVHPKTVAKWARCGILPVVRIRKGCIRFDVEECDALLKKRTRICG